MSANTLWRWLRSRAEPGRVAWATGAPAQPSAAPPNGARRVSISAVPPGADGAGAGEEKEWEPGVWARAAIGIYS